MVDRRRSDPLIRATAEVRVGIRGGSFRGPEPALRAIAVVLSGVLAVESSAKRVQSLAGRLTQVVTADCTDIDALRSGAAPRLASTAEDVRSP
jgi:hypothetical protein